MLGLIAGTEVLSVLGLMFAAVVAGPHVAWGRRAMGMELHATLRWPPERPAGLDRRYRYDSSQTGFMTPSSAAFAVVLTQLLWTGHPWWMLAVGWVVAALRSGWMWRLIRADGGLGV